MSANLKRARDALFACDPNCDREAWVHLAMASKSAGIDLDTFDAWSAQADNYRERDTRSMWRSIRARGWYRGGHVVQGRRAGRMDSDRASATQ